MYRHGERADQENSRLFAESNPFVQNESANRFELWIGMYYCECKAYNILNKQTLFFTKTVQFSHRRDKDTEQAGLTEDALAETILSAWDNFLLVNFLLTLLPTQRRSTTEQRTRWFFVMCCTIRTPRGTGSEHSVHCCISMPCRDLKWW